MNNYITLDSYKYKCPFREWAQVIDKPASVMVCWNGSVNVSYGPGTLYSWEGAIEGPVTADGTGWGTIANLRTTLAKRTSLTMIDHYGTTYTVHVFLNGKEKSLTPKWDGAANVIFIPVKVYREA